MLVCLQMISPKKALISLHINIIDTYSYLNRTLYIDTATCQFLISAKLELLWHRNLKKKRKMAMFFSDFI